MSNHDGEGRTALITGASAGIGAALARVFAEHGFNVVLTARREDRLAALASELSGRFGVVATPIPADLAEADAPRRLYDAIETRGISVDALVNNAGYGVPRAFRKAPWETHAAFMQVLVAAVLELTHRFEPGMTARRYGRILNVASLAGLLPGAAGHTLYGAAKSFVIKFSESLALEHANDGVHVTALCPGFTHTEFHDVAGLLGLKKRLPSPLWMDADAVARDGYRAVMAGEPLCVPGAVNRAIASATRLIPESLALKVMKSQSKRIRRAE